MADVVSVDSETLSVEFFAAKDTPDVIMAVPLKCGLNQADTLRIDGLFVVALQARSILPIDFPALNEASRARLVALSRLGRRLPVGEFMGLGLVDSYFLDVVIAG